MAAKNTTPAPRRPEAVPGVPVLEVTAGVDRGRRFELTEAQTVIGRDDTAIALRDSGVSRRHAKMIVAADNSVMVMDLGSTNRTLVNGTDVELATLMPGDVIKLGPSAELRLSYGPAAAPTTDVVLSDRQLEVARLVAEGMSNASVAAELSISPNTVARHLENIYDRLGMRSRTALARWLIDAGHA